MATGEDFYELYRAPSPTGNGTKDWAIKVDDDGHIIVRYGTTGASLRTRIIPTKTPWKDKSDRISEKVLEGYKLVGQFHISDTGKLTPSSDIERLTWNLDEVDADMFYGPVKIVADALNEHEYVNETLRVDFDSNEGIVTFMCDGYLPSDGWRISTEDAITKLPSGKIVGGGKINYDMQTLIIAAIANMMNGKLNAVASKGSATRSILPDKPRPSAEYLDSLSMPEYLAKDVARATGLIPKPIQVFMQSTVSTGIGFSF